MHLRKTIPSRPSPKLFQLQQQHHLPASRVSTRSSSVSSLVACAAARNLSDGPPQNHNNSVIIAHNNQKQTTKGHKRRYVKRKCAAIFLALVVAVSGMPGSRHLVAPPSAHAAAATTSIVADKEVTTESPPTSSTSSRMDLQQVQLLTTTSPFKPPIFQAPEPDHNNDNNKINEEWSTIPLPSSTIMTPKSWSHNQYQIKKRDQVSAIVFLAAAALGTRMGTQWEPNRLALLEHETFGSFKRHQAADKAQRKKTLNKNVQLEMTPAQQQQQPRVVDKKANNNTNTMPNATPQPTTTRRRRPPTPKQKEQFMQICLRKVQGRQAALDREREHHRNIRRKRQEISVKEAKQRNQLRAKEAEQHAEEAKQRDQWLVLKQQQALEAKVQRMNSIAASQQQQRAANKTNTSLNNDATNKNLTVVDDDDSEGGDNNEEEDNENDDEDNDDIGKTDCCLSSRLPTELVPPLEEYAGPDEEETSPREEGFPPQDLSTLERKAQQYTAEPHSSPYRAVNNRAIPSDELLHRKLLQYRIELDHQQGGALSHSAVASVRHRGEEGADGTVLEQEQAAHQLLKSRLPLEANIHTSQEEAVVLEASLSVEPNAKHSTSGNPVLQQEQEQEQRKMLGDSFAMETKEKIRRYRKAAKEERWRRTLLEARFAIKAREKIHRKAAKEEQCRRKLLETRLIFDAKASKKGSSP